MDPKHVHAPSQTTPETAPGDIHAEAANFDTIRDVTQIVRLLKTALIEGENIEIQINERSRTFFSYFMDHPPEPPPEPPADSSQATNLFSSNAPGTELVTPTQRLLVPAQKEITYEPFSYIHKKEHLLLSPLVPAVGNALIRSSTEVVLRFFQGVKGLDANVVFMGTLLVQGEPAIQVSFPKTMRIQRKRRHFRAKITDEVTLALKIQKNNKTVLSTRVIDISVGGLAFCNPLDPTLFPLEELFDLTLETPDLPPVVVRAFIRNQGRASIKDGCSKGVGRIGVQFDIPNEHKAMEIEELVAYVQRSFIQVIQERKHRVRHNHDAVEQPLPEEKKRSSLSEDLKNLLHLKKEYRFK